MWISLGKRGAIGVLALSACAAVAAPLLPMGEDATFASAGGDERTTIKLRCGADSPIVLKLTDMRMGETRDVVAESGKPVTVTRTEDGYKLKIGDKDFDVRTPGSLPGGGKVMVFSGDGDQARKTMVMAFDSSEGGPGKKVFVRHGGSGSPAGHGFAFSTGDRKPAKTAAELLDAQDLTALRGADRRTRDTVAQALAELMEKGVVIAPLCLGAGLPGDAVEIEVDSQRTTDSK